MKCIVCKEAEARTATGQFCGKRCSNRYNATSKQSVKQRIEAGSVVDPRTGCWVWQRSFTRAAGYAQMRVAGKPGYVHRLAYREYVGPIPPGLTLDHLCRNPKCVYFAHLEPVTMRENTARGTSPMAANIRKTHCKRGHEFTPENTRRYRGQRNCRICHREYMAMYDHNRRRR